MKLTQAQDASRAMLMDAIKSAPTAHLPLWLLDGLALSSLPDEALDDLGNRIGRIAHERARAAQ